MLRASPRQDAPAQAHASPRGGAHLGEAAMRPESSKSRRKKDPSPMDSLTDDLVVEILSRLPVKSLCRCKAVSRRWRTLICYEDQHRRKLSQTLPGLFYASYDSRRFPKEARHFTHVWEGRWNPLVCPSLSFLPWYERISIVDSCNGMLLCCFSESILHDAFRYVVCNPVEESFTVLPDSGCGANERVACLAFDPARYPSIHVLEFVNDNETGDVFGANIFSSQTGEWSYKECQWGPDACMFYEARCVYSNGFLYLIARSCEALLVVDVEGDIWSTISLPSDLYIDPDGDDDLGFIGIYQGRLCYIAQESDTHDISIWILVDLRNGCRVMRHHMTTDHLCEKQIGQYRSSSFVVVGILQDCNFILYVAGRTLMACDIDGEEVHAIQKLERGSCPPFFLYVPFYIE